MSRRILAFAVLAVVAGGVAKAESYDPTADAWAELQKTAAAAASSGRLVLAVVGGNWCKWCRALDQLLDNDAAIRQAIADRFELVHVNYSKENRNEAVLERLRRPDKLGFPVLVVLSPELQVLRQQSTEGFETGDPNRPGHDPAKLLAFLESWGRRPQGSAASP